jgi:uncharacterized ion transporter superfamily protein YfcC
MSSKELIALLIKVISSGPVIVITIVIFLYFYLVSYVARIYHRPTFSTMFPSKQKSKKHKAASAEPESDESEDSEKSSDDELGLEEE